MEYETMSRDVSGDIIEQVAEATGLGAPLVERICKAQFRFVAHTIRSGSMDTVHLDYVGKFKVNKKRKLYLDAKTKKIL